MLKWLQRPFQSQQPAPDAALPEGWFAPQSAERLLATPLRQSCLHQLRQLTPLPDPLFDSWIITAIHRFAALVQQLSASQSHHHSAPGGLLDHSLEVACNAARLRQGYLLPADTGAEEQARQADAWTVAVICAALLHDTGKIAVDMEIHQHDGTRWFPWLGNLAQPYTWRWRSGGRDYHLHPAAGALLVVTLLPPDLISWLAGYPALFSTLIYQLTGCHERAGVLAELVQQADKASVAKNLGGDIPTALAQRPENLAQRLRMALRSLVQDEYRLNNPDCGSDGWLTEEALWLVSKITADRLRAWLLQHGVTGVPENNNRLFDELLAHQLVVANGDKAIWRCSILSAQGWTPGEPLTLLRVSPSIIWEPSQPHPPCFEGNVTPFVGGEKDGITAVPALQQSDTHVSCAENHSASGEDASSGAALRQPDTTEPVRATDGGAAFLLWLQHHVTLPAAVNTRTAYVHLVNDDVFLVTPGIFKHYAKETTGSGDIGWQQVQKSFQTLAVHRRGDDGVNIWNCEVKTPGKPRNLKGFLVPEPERIFGDRVPMNNPWLRLIT